MPTRRKFQLAMTILIVEDDDSVARFLVQALSEAGYNADLARDGLAGRDLAITRDYDLILLDIMLPGMNGFEVCRQVRASNIGTPILMITARDTVEDKVRGLDTGADDYIVKPFQLAELFARVRALLRRGASSPAVLTVGDLALNPADRLATRGGKTITLSSTEYALLEYLMRNSDRVLTRSMILEHVWQYDFGGNDNILDVYINYLRGKVDKGFEDPLIHTIRGVGYTLRASNV
jgi:two-component system copper resistance phosphate regulon response regulator CusR